MTLKSKLDGNAAIHISYTYLVKSVHSRKPRFYVETIVRFEEQITRATIAVTTTCSDDDDEDVRFIPYPRYIMPMNYY